MPRVSVVIADDYPDVLEDIRDLLEPEFEVVGVAGDGRELLALVEECDPGVIVTDVSMPVMNGIEASRSIIEKRPGAKIILLTVHNDPGVIAQGFAAGALGYVLKNAASQELPRAIRHVLGGRPYVSESVKV